MSDLPGKVYRLSLANKAYANGQPIMTDPEYDQLWREVFLRDPSNDALWHTGKETLVGNFPHPRPLLSLNKAMDFPTFKVFLKRYANETIIAQPKYDGVAAVIYPTPTHYRVVLSGDGIQGKDVTRKLTYAHIPQVSTDAKHRVEGELLIPWHLWRPDLGKHPRNVVAGFVSRDYLADDYQRLIHFIPHNQLHYTLPTNDPTEAWDKCLELFNEWHKQFPLDGVVLKVLSDKIRLRDGHNGDYPYWAIAWKPPIQTAETIVEEIEWNVSRTGRVVPTVIYSPVELAGTTNTRATGNNAEWIKDRGIRVGATITIGKAGEIIPKIISVRDGDPSNVSLPTTCPTCGGPLYLSDKDLMCDNIQCIRQIIKQLCHFYSLNNMRVKGIKESTLEKILQHPHYLYAFRKKPWFLFFLAYRIPSELYNILGNRAAYIIASAYEIRGKKTIANLASAFGITDLGPNRIRSIMAFMQGAHTKFIKRSHIDKFVEYYPMILQAKKDLEEWGFEFLPLPKPSGIVFAITGPLPLDRVEAAQLLENHGWEWSASGVTKACNLLITNLTTPTNKYKKAVERGIEIITWDEALNRIGVKADEDW